MIFYPKFLSSKPKFFGLELVDILIFAVMANLFNHLGFSNLFGVISCITIVALKLLVIRFVDFQGLFHSYPKVLTLKCHFSEDQEGQS